VVVNLQVYTTQADQQPAIRLLQEVVNNGSIITVRNLCVSISCRLLSGFYLGCLAHESGIKCCYGTKTCNFSASPSRCLATQRFCCPDLLV
jgi:hypothetical protein